MAACYARLDRTEEAEKAIAEVMKQSPNFSVSRQRGGGWLLQSVTHLREGMIKAGLPE